MDWNFAKKVLIQLNDFEPSVFTPPYDPEFNAKNVYFGKIVLMVCHVSDTFLSNSFMVQLARIDLYNNTIIWMNP